MATSARIRTLTNNVRRATETKRQRVAELRVHVEEARRHMDYLLQATNDWEREMNALMADFNELDKLAQEIDEVEKRM